MASVVTSREASNRVGAGDAPIGADAMPRPWLAAWTLCRREWVRFIRQGNRVFAALGQPIIFWLLLSLLLGSSFQMGGTSGALPTAPAAATTDQSPAAAIPLAAADHPAITYTQYF